MFRFFVWIFEEGIVTGSIIKHSFRKEKFVGGSIGERSTGEQC